MTDAAFAIPLVIEAAFVLLTLALAGAIFRILRGPSLPDRVLGLDLMSVLLLCFGAVFALATGESAFLDVALTLALVGFLATVALARYVERRWVREQEAAGEGRAPAAAAGSGSRQHP